MGKKYLPERLIEYVIFHEMAHSWERKHNERFWNAVSKKFKDHQKREKELLVHWFLVQKIIARTTNNVESNEVMARLMFQNQNVEG